MKLYVIIMIVILMIAPFSVQAIGGQKQVDMLCPENEHRGVGRIYKYDPDIVYDLDHNIPEQGTVQLLPHTSRRLCITAKHCVQAGIHRTGIEMNGIFIWASRIFQHPYVDLAIVELEEGMPYVSESDLPPLSLYQNRVKLSKLVDSAESSKNETIEAIVVGFGHTSSDALHPGVMLSQGFEPKRKGYINVKSRKGELVSKWLLSDDERQVFVAAGDSGGPVIAENRLVGIAIQEYSNLNWLKKGFKRIGRRKMESIESQGEEPLLKFRCNQAYMAIYPSGKHLLVFSNADDESYDLILDMVIVKGGLYQASQVPAFQNVVNALLNIFKNNKVVAHKGYFIDLFHHKRWIDGIYSVCGYQPHRE